MAVKTADDWRVEGGSLLRHRLLEGKVKIGLSYEEGKVRIGIGMTSVMLQKSVEMPGISTLCDM